MASRHLRMRLNIRWPPLLEDPGRTLRRGLRKALQAGAEYWRDTLLPIHFKRAAYHKYAGGSVEVMRPGGDTTSSQLYKHRDEGVFPTKMARGSGGARRTPYETLESDGRPIYMTGRTKRMVMRTARGQSERKWPGTTSTSAKARIKFAVPGYIKAHQQNRAAAPGFAESMPHYPMIDEICAMDEQDRKRVTNVVRETLGDWLRKHPRAAPEGLNL